MTSGKVVAAKYIRASRVDAFVFITIVDADNNPITPDSGQVYEFNPPGN